MIVTCRGSSLHFFDAGAGKSGSDKFYNVFFYQENGRYVLVAHYGRDGTAGQVADQTFTSLYDCSDALEKRVREKLRKGYEAMGSGVTPVTQADHRSMGSQFALEVRQRQPDKTRMTGGFLIAERPDAEDLMADLMARKP